MNVQDHLKITNPDETHVAGCPAQIYEKEGKLDVEILNKNRMRLEITKKMYIKNVDLADML